MEKVTIRLLGEQKSATGEVTRIDQVAYGEYREKAGKHYISYFDASIDEKQPVSTMLKLSPDALTIIRKGAVEGTQHFTINGEDSSVYNTPYGTLALKIRTTKLIISMQELSSEVDFAYDVLVNGEFSGHNRLNIKINK